MPLPILPHCWCGCLPLPSPHTRLHSAWTPQGPGLAIWLLTRISSLGSWETGKHLASQRIRGTAWAQSYWLVSGTWFDHSSSRFFMFLCPCLSSGVVPAVYVLLFWFGLFLRLGWKNHLAPLYPVQRTAVSFPCPPVHLPSPLPLLFLPYLCKRGIAVKAERR